MELIAPLSGPLYLLFTMLNAPAGTRKQECIVARKELAGVDPDGVLKWIAFVWALAFLPVLLISFPLEWALKSIGIGDVLGSAISQSLVGLPIAGALWYLLAFALRGDQGRPRIFDDLLVLGVVIAFTIWLSS